MASFLSDQVEGNQDTFSAHALQFYFPAIWNRTYQKYGLRLDIYTMEGFKSINYSKKFSIQHHSNCCGNIFAQTMTRIVHRYMNHHHNIKKQKRKKCKSKVLEENQYDSSL